MPSQVTNFYKRDCLHRDLSYSVSLDKSKQFNINIQQIQSEYHGFNKNSENNGVATYPWVGGRGEMKNCVFQKGERVGVATNVYSRKKLEKPKIGMWISKKKVRELFTRGEGISTARIRHKGRQPWICGSCIVLMMPKRNDFIVIIKKGENVNVCIHDFDDAKDKHFSSLIQVKNSEIQKFRK